jgi:hypothetical protein
MDLHLVFYYIGIAIIFLSHIGMLFSKSAGARTHAAVNLFAGACIAYYFMNKERFIHF